MRSYLDTKKIKVSPLRMRSSGDLDVDHPDPRVGGGAHGGRHQAADPHVPLAGQAAQLLLLEVVDSEDVGGHHDHHRDVE